MINEREVYLCKICGIVTEILRGGSGAPLCCGEPMARQIENTTDAAKEKHVPVLEKTFLGHRATVGSVPHPMEPHHFIAWIEFVTDTKTHRQFLQPGMKPEAECQMAERQVGVRAFCNIHGLWKT